MRATVIATICIALLTCDGRRSELPPLLAPADLLPEDEAVYMHAHLDQFIRAVADNDDRHYDDKYQVEVEYSRLIRHIRRWHKMVGHPKRWLYEDMKWQQLQRTPEARHYRGARQKAVAMGLLALSIWQRNPGQGRPTAEQMEICAKVVWTPRCFLDGRTLSLEHMVRMGMGADRDLFMKQRQKARELERHENEE